MAPPLFSRIKTMMANRRQKRQQQRQQHQQQRCNVVALPPAVSSQNTTARGEEYAYEIEHEIHYYERQPPLPQHNQHGNTHDVVWSNLVDESWRTSTMRKIKIGVYNSFDDTYEWGEEKEEDASFPSDEEDEKENDEGDDEEEGEVELLFSERPPYAQKYIYHIHEVNSNINNNHNHNSITNIGRNTTPTISPSGRQRRFSVISDTSSYASSQYSSVDDDDDDITIASEDEESSAAASCFFSELALTPKHNPNNNTNNLKLTRPSSSLSTNSLLDDLWEQLDVANLDIRSMRL